MEPGHGKTVRLYYCVRSAKEALFFDELAARAAELGNRCGSDIIPEELESSPLCAWCAHVMNKDD